MNSTLNKGPTMTNEEVQKTSNSVDVVIKTEPIDSIDRMAEERRKPQEVRDKIRYPTVTTHQESSFSGQNSINSQTSAKAIAKMFRENVIRDNLNRKTDGNIIGQPQPLGVNNLVKNVTQVQPEPVLNRNLEDKDMEKGKMDVVRNMNTNLDDDIKGRSNDDSTTFQASTPLSRKSDNPKEASVKPRFRFYDFKTNKVTEASSIQIIADKVAGAQNEKQQMKQTQPKKSRKPLQNNVMLSNPSSQEENQLVSNPALPTLHNSSSARQQPIQKEVNKVSSTILPTLTPKYNHSKRQFPSTSHQKKENQTTLAPSHQQAPRGFSTLPKQTTLTQQKIIFEAPKPKIPILSDAGTSDQLDQENPLHTAASPVDKNLHSRILQRTPQGKKSGPSGKKRPRSPSPLQQSHQSVANNELSLPQSGRPTKPLFVHKSIRQRVSPQSHFFRSSLLQQPANNGASTVPQNMRQVKNIPTRNITKAGNTVPLQQIPSTQGTPTSAVQKAAQKISSKVPSTPVDESIHSRVLQKTPQSKKSGISGNKRPTSPRPIQQDIPFISAQQPAANNALSLPQRDRPTKSVFGPNSKRQRGYPQLEFCGGTTPNLLSPNVKVPLLTGDESVPQIMVNFKQYRYIVKRMRDRRNLVQEGIIPREREKEVCESRRQHALNRNRTNEGRYAGSSKRRNLESDFEEESDQDN